MTRRLRLIWHKLRQIYGITTKSACGVIAALVILGCSGLSTLRVKNLTGDPIQVSVEGKVEDRPDSFEVDLATGGLSKDGLKWYMMPPESLEVTVKSGDSVRKARLTKQQYPEPMKRGSSAASEYYLLVDRDAITVADHLPGMPPLQLAAIVWAAFVVTGAGIGLWLWKRKRPTPPPSLP
ncbi:MAG: hypothetical protein K1X67_23915 [Fimbriimonadaceae bacterium]|nr:hypothetical protein [Fimbriimonadaceae bacterium]